MNRQSVYRPPDDVAIQQSRIIDRYERRNLVPYSDAHIDRLEQAGKFPQRIKLGKNRVGWRLVEVLEWIAQKDAESRGSSSPKTVKLS